MKNKSGMVTMQLFLFIFIFLFVAIFLGLAVWGFNLVNDVLDVDVDIGQVNLRTVNNQTFGRIAESFTDSADTIGIVLLLGMCVLMILNGYFVGSRFPKLFLIVDIFILVFIFITAIYLAQTYEIIINVDVVSDIYQTDIDDVSKFMLNLPLIVSTVGVLIMIVSYAGIRKDDQGEGINVYGY